ncbi:MAG: hypothetical protein JST54_08875 [Deltaproteobacteria bacterium]|nr:hypothetical protein [Deltaproteobacteria bacterium]
MDAAAIPGAVCGVHPDQALSFTCARCGSFGCERCRAGDGTICATCAARNIAVPISAGAILSESFSLLPKTASRLAPVSLIQFATSVATALWTTLVYKPMLRDLGKNAAKHPDLDGLLELYAGMFKPLGWLMVVAIFTGALTMCWWVQIFGDAARGQEKSLGAQVLAGIKAYPATLVSMLARSLATGVGVVLCCVPGIAFYALLGMSASAAGLGGKGPGGALVESWRLASRRFWLVVGVEGIGMAGILGAAFAGGGISRVLEFLGTPGEVIGALANALITLVPTLLLYSLETVLYVRIRAADGATSR